MTNTHKTKHAVDRMAQRGFRVEDAELVLLVDTRLPNGILVRERDCKALEVACHQFLASLRRLPGKLLVEESGHIITAYRPGRRTKRRLIRGTEDRELDG